MPGMTGLQAFNETKQALDYLTGTAHDTEVLAALNWAQENAEQGGGTLPWFIIAEDQSITTTTTTQEVSLPTGFLAETDNPDAGLRYRNTAVSGSRTFFLQKMSFKDAEKYFFGDWQSNFDNDSVRTTDALTPGVPKAYVLRKTTIRVYPLPDAAYTLTWDFYKAQDPIAASGATNAWLTYAPWLIIGGAVAKVGADIGSPDLVAKGNSLASVGKATMINSQVRREIQNRPLRMGSRL